MNFMYVHNRQLSVYIQIQLDYYNTANSWFSLHETLISREV